MRKSILWPWLGLFFIIMFSGCTVRHYVVPKDRVDQDLTGGNQGYLAGQVPESLETETRKTTRDTYVTEIELPGFGKKEKPKAKVEAETKVEEKADIEEPQVAETTVEETPMAEVEEKVNFEKYTVQGGDTLEKISKKFYGTTRKWHKIFEANKNTLKAPDKIYQGQILNIPVEGLKEPRENLK